MMLTFVSFINFTKINRLQLKLVGRPYLKLKPKHNPMLLVCPWAFVEAKNIYSEKIQNKGTLESNKFWPIIPANFH